MRSRTMPEIPPCGPWPLVTQNRNSRVRRSDAERVQMVWRSSSMRVHETALEAACGL
jgi:hypothetical protein